MKRRGPMGVPVWPVKKRRNLTHTPADVAVLPPVVVDLETRTFQRADMVPAE